MTLCHVELLEPDLVHGRRRDEQDLGLVRQDVRMVDYGGQVLLVLVEWDVLRCGRQRDHGVVGPEQDNLNKRERERDQTQLEARLVSIPGI